MRLLTFFALAASTGLFAPSTHAAVNLISNGSFESVSFSGDYALVPTASTSITNWTTTLNGVEWFQPSTYLGGVVGNAADGLAAIDLATYTYTAGGIEQAITTTSGQQYQVTFMGGTANSFGRDGTGKIELTFGNLSTQTFNLTNNTGAIVWTPLSFTFTANLTGSTTIAFSNHEDANTHFAFLDDVSVTAIPEPATAAAGLGLAALAAVLVVRARRSRRLAR